MRWLTFGVIFMEMMICFKFSRDAQNLDKEAYMNPVLKVMWCIIFTALALGYFYLRLKPDHTVKFIEKDDKRSIKRRSSPKRSPKRSP